MHEGPLIARNITPKVAVMRIKLINISISAILDLSFIAPKYICYTNDRFIAYFNNGI